MDLSARSIKLTSDQISNLMLLTPPSKRDPRTPPVVRGFLTHLEERGSIDRIGAERALQAQSQTGHRIDTVLTELGLVQDRPLLEALSSFVAIPIIEPKDFPAEPVTEAALPLEFLRSNSLLPIAVSADSIVVAVSDPFADDVLANMAYSLDRRIEPRLSSAADISTALERLYLTDAASDAEPVEHGAFASDEDIQRLKDIASEAPVIKIVSRVISSAAMLRASDIHIEPMADHLRVRYRIDGVMQEAERLPPDLQAAISSRIKILARLNIAERRLPQDGRAKFIASGREIDLRISTAPVMHGESIVLRLLDQSHAELDFGSLGFDAHLVAILTNLLAHPNGIVLVTGPTGSGKTTTLYASLRTLNTVERKIFTVEDPIEYNLPGINQMQIKPDIGLDFAHCLRSILRQDPDVIMIGEMRDLETARIGIQSSLTGHLVLSTLHTNSAAASVARLLDMGVEDYLLASTLKGIIAQRLVRRLCPSCATRAPATQDDVQRLRVILGPHVSEASNWNLKRPVGCTKCNGIGFKGRTTIYEALIIDEAIQAEIRKGQTESKLDAISRAHGMITLLQSGVLKVIHGETTLSEVSKAVRT